jgi:hypothetical protein
VPAPLGQTERSQNAWATALPGPPGRGFHRIQHAADAGAAARGVLKSVAASPNPNAENLNPKEIRNSKSRKTSLAGGWPSQRLKPFSDFGLRASFGFRSSAFGFQGCRSCSSCYRPDFRAALSSGRPASRPEPGSRAGCACASRANLPGNCTGSNSAARPTRQCPQRRPEIEKLKSL